MSLPQQALWWAGKGAWERPMNVFSRGKATLTAIWCMRIYTG